MLINLKLLRQQIYFPTSLSVTRFSGMIAQHRYWFLACLVLVALAVFVAARGYAHKIWPFAGAAHSGATTASQEALRAKAEVAHNVKKADPEPSRKPEKPGEKTKISSVFVSIMADVYPLPFKDTSPSSGPFEVLTQSRFLFVTSCGDVHFARISSDGKMINERPAIELVPANSVSPSPVYCRGKRTGVKDTHLSGRRLFVAYNIFDRQAVGVRLVVAEFQLGDADLKFQREIFRSSPAIKEPMWGHQSGGRIESIDSALFIALGDFGNPNLIAAPGSNLGRIVSVDLLSLEVTEVSKGHRSPGGLLYEPEYQRLWETEHGPRGGDEINLIVHGKHYGWPHKSYGTLYDIEGGGNYYGTGFNAHDGFERPRFIIFGDGIGIGAIAKYPHTGHIAYWSRDFFVAAMQSKELLRLRVEGDQILYSERVLSGFRIRDLHVDRDGVMYLKTDDSLFIRSAIPPGVIHRDSDQERTLNTTAQIR